MIMHSEENPEIFDVIDETDFFFGDDSPLIRAVEHGGPQYEHRPEQVKMAHYIAESFENNNNLCIEAPTGVGKSFAYLVPAVYFSINCDYPVIVSTETISLQEQLISKDIPLIKGLLDIEFSAVLAKGRGNYICRRRLSLVAGKHSQDYLPMKNMKSLVEDIAELVETEAKETRSDFNFEINGQVWESICCEMGNCAGPKCSFFRNCFYWKARKEWDRADIIVANHALLFTDMKLKSCEISESSLLPPYGSVILDESHLLEDCAAQHLGLRVSSKGLIYLLKKLFDPEKQRGALMRSGEDCLEMRSVVAEALTSTDKFFNALNDVMCENRKEEMRLIKPGVVNDSITVPIGNLEKILRDYIKLQEDEDYRQEMTSVLQKCSAYHTEIFDFINMEREEHVYWIEKKGMGDNVILNAAPLNVNVLLQNLLFSKDFPVVLTSATLSVNGNLDYYRERTGFMNGPEVSLGTPFDFQKQVHLYASRKIPLPKEDNYESVITEQVRHFVSATHGKAFVLFTSYYMLKQIADALRDFFDEKGIKLFVQGEGMSRTAMLNEFRTDTDSVIFGTSSFWMGVDVPGEALSNVIITKLPFSVPDHPLVQARSEKIEQDGKSSFMHYQLPEAVLKFKQGIGRLIRSKKDNGIIVILDSRVLNKSYGKVFINSIPPCPMSIY